MSIQRRDSCQSAWPMLVVVGVPLLVAVSTRWPALSKGHVVGREVSFALGLALSARPPTRTATTTTRTATAATRPTTWTTTATSARPATGSWTLPWSHVRPHRSFPNAFRSLVVGTAASILAYSRITLSPTSEALHLHREPLLPLCKKRNRTDSKKAVSGNLLASLLGERF